MHISQNFSIFVLIESTDLVTNRATGHCPNQLQPKIGQAIALVFLSYGAAFEANKDMHFKDFTPQ